MRSTAGFPYGEYYGCYDRCLPSRRQYLLYPARCCWLGTVMQGGARSQSDSGTVRRLSADTITLHGKLFAEPRTTRSHAPSCIVWATHLEIRSPSDCFHAGQRVHAVRRRCEFLDPYHRSVLCDCSMSNKVPLMLIHFFAA